MESPGAALRGAGFRSKPGRSLRAGIWNSEWMWGWYNDDIPCISFFFRNRRFANGKFALNQRKRSEEHTSELQSLMRISYAVFCLKTKKTNTSEQTTRERHMNDVTKNYLNRHTNN